jgi:hypothetical protein
MKGGVGRYTYQLVHALRKKKKINKNIDVHIAIGSHSEPRRTTTSPGIVNNSSNNISYNNADDNNKGSNKEEDDNTIYYGVIKKGDTKNSDRLLYLIRELKPDIVNVQYERGLYEIDTTVYHMLRRVLYGSTLDKFYKECSVPTVSTLHTVIPYDEYQEYIKERALTKEGRFASLPLSIVLL